MVRCVCYCRQSDTGGAGAESLSLASQESVLRERAGREGWQVVEVVRDADVRGWQEAAERPGLERVFALARGRAFDVLLVWRLDRLARSVRIQEQLVFSLGLAGVDVESHTEPHARAAPMIRQILGAVAEEQTRTISAHVRRAVRQRPARGLACGPAPYGYRRPGRNLPLVPEPGEAAVVLALYEARADGATVVECARLGRALAGAAGVGGPGNGAWLWQTVDRMLRLPTYRGVASCADASREGAHAAIVGDALWRRAQRPAARHGTRHGGGLSWLEGLVDHACGGRMHLSARASDTSPVPRFVCPDLGRDGRDRGCRVLPCTILSGRAEERAVAALGRDLDRLRPAAEVVAEARERWQAESGDAAAELRDLARRRARAEARRARAVDLYLSGGIDRARHDAEQRAADDEAAEVARREAALPARPDAAAVREACRELREVREVLGVLRSDGLARVVRMCGRVLLLPEDGADPVRRNRGRVAVAWRPGLRDLVGG